MNKENKKSIQNVAKKGRGRVISNRLGVLFIIILLAFVGLSLRILSITRDNNDAYQQKILSQQMYDSQTINAKRGEIVDCNGTVLAASKECYNVILDTYALLDADDETQKCTNATVNALVNIFGADRNSIYEYMRDVPDSRYYIVKKEITYDEMSRFLSLTTKPDEDDVKDSLYDENIQGVWFEKYYVRDYPQNTLACDVIGFSNSNGQSSYGLEEYYDDVLTGTAGRKYGYLSGDTTFEVTTIPAVDGDTLISTLDSNVQMIIEKYMKQFCEEYANNARDGLGANNIGCIVMRANTGEILGMGSYPNFDLNNPTDLSSLYSEEQISAMKEEKTFQDACDALWKNFCIADTYEPGSVMKPFTVAMGLETGKVTGNESYYCNGYLTVADHDIHCHNRNGDGYLDVRGAVAQSCNVALMQMVSTIGSDIFLDYQNIFNFGLKTNIDLAGEARTDSVVFTKTTLGESELATASFGQGFNTTMIQMCAGYAALVNGGYYYEPHMVSQIVSAGGSVVKNIEPRLIKQVVSAETSDMIVSYCNSVVTDGTGWRAKPAGYAIGGKTGTAETLPRGNGEYVVSFICHAPAVNPEIICYVVIDRPNVAVQEDAKYATIVSNQIMTELLPYFNIPMTEELTDQDLEDLASLDLSVITNRIDVSDNNPEAPETGAKDQEPEGEN